MAQIQWTTIPGNLGTYAEAQEFTYQLDAVVSSGSATYRVISGKLPPGLELYRSGKIYGVPSVLANSTPKGQTFEFAVRASDNQNKIADRSFSITINGIIPPTLIANEETLGNYFDSDYIAIQLQYVEFNPGTTLKWSIVKGTLPLGLNLTQDGRITGFAFAPAAGGPGGTNVFDAGKYDQYVFDSEGATLSRTSKFTIRLEDGILATDRRYSITVFARSFFRTDNALLHVDTIDFTADRDGYQYPTIITEQIEILPVRQDRHYAFQFKAYFPDVYQQVYWEVDAGGSALFDMGAPPTPDDNGDQFEAIAFDNDYYDQQNLSVPAGLVLDRKTGWLTGTIGPTTEKKSTYSFRLIAYIEVPISATAVSIRASAPRIYELEILSDINDVLVWNTATDLGIVNNGDISKLFVKATANRGQALTYSIQSGAGQATRLPQGLNLLPSGLIAGRTTFDYFSMDRHAVEVTLNDGSTTFDSSYTFTVLAQDASGFVFDAKEFTITVRNVNVRPYENLYMRAMLPANLRQRFITTINDPLIIQDLPDYAIYRNGDPYFGLATDIKFLAIPGLVASAAQDYINAMVRYHRNKKVNFSELKWAVALDENLDPQYEVVYIEAQDYNDTALTTLGYNLSTQNPLRISDLGRVYDALRTEESLGVLYEGLRQSEDLGRVPDRVENDLAQVSFANSFGNMIAQMVKQIGYEYQGALPAWMTSIQPDTGQPLGFKRAVVLAYLAPGYGKSVLFRIAESLKSSGFGVKTLINQWSFEADRYQWDHLLTTNYDSTTHKFIPAQTTTFDKQDSIGLVYQGPWTQQPVEVTTNLRGIEFGGAEYLAIGDNATILTSVGGYKWKQFSQTINLDYRAGINLTALPGTKEFSFAYGTQFSLGDLVVSQPSGVGSFHLYQSRKTYSWLFNGTTDWFTAPSNETIRTLSGGIFTLETWIYPTAYAAGVLGVSEERTIFSTADAACGFRISIDTTGIRFWDYSGLTRVSAPVLLNTWTHVAFTYNAGDLVLYIDGVETDSATGVTWNNDTTDPTVTILTIGATNDGVYVYPYAGYISDLRLTTSRVYTANFVPPGYPLSTSVGSTVQLLVAHSSTLIDNGYNAFALTADTTSASAVFFSPFTDGSYITEVKEYITMSTVSQGYIPAGTEIEFINYSGEPSSLTLAKDVASGTNSYSFGTIITLEKGYVAQIKGIKTYSIDTTVTQIFTGNNTVYLSSRVDGVTEPLTTITFIDPGNNAYIDLIVSTYAASGTDHLSFVSGVTALAVGFIIRSIYTYGNEPTKVLNKFTGNNTILLSSMTTNAIPSGTTITFDDLSGTLANVNTADNTTVNSYIMALDDVTDVPVNSYLRLANIATNNHIRSLNSNVVVTRSNLERINSGAEMYFTSVITANAAATDKTINLSSTKKIGVGSSVTGESIVTSTLYSATWPAQQSGSSLDITIPTADIVGVKPFAGMTVLGYELPYDGSVIDVVEENTDTVVTISYSPINISGNPKKIRSAKYSSTISNKAKKIGQVELTKPAITEVFTANNTVTIDTPIAYTIPLGTNLAMYNTVTTRFTYANLAVTAASGDTQLTFTESDRVAVLTTSCLTNTAHFGINRNDYIVTANNTIASKAVVTDILPDSSTILFTPAVIKTNAISAGETVTFQTRAALEFTSPQITSPGTVVVSKTDTSVTLNYPLINPVRAGYDNVLRFGLGEIRLNSMLYVAPNWYVVGSKGTVLKRLSDKTWIQTVALDYGDLLGLAYTRGELDETWIVVGTEGLIARSHDYSTWLPLESGVNVNLNSIEFHGGLFVIVGNKGTILYSDDNGDTWSINNSTTTKNLKSVRYLNGKWIIVGEKGIVLISLLGTGSWTAYSSGTTNTLNDVSYVNNLYFAVGTKGTVVESTTGTAWELRNYYQNNDLLSIAKNGSTPLVSGSAGLVLTETNEFIVNWAVRGISFEMFNYNKVEDLARQGYGVSQGDTVIFYQQEGFDPTKFRGYKFENDGWNQYDEVFGGATVESSFDVFSFDEKIPVPGYYESLNGIYNPINNTVNNNVSNQRGGVWSVNLNAAGIVYLTFLRQVRFGQIVTVKSESAKLIYDPTIDSGKTQPSYRPVTQLRAVQILNTTFDAGGTRFSSPRDTYLSDPSSYDKYLKFPTSGVIQ